MRISVFPPVWTVLLLALTLVTLVGCGSGNVVYSGDTATEAGDHVDKITGFLGPPQYRKNSGEGEIWQYCSTGINSDVYRVFWVRDDKVIATSSYIVQWAFGFCTSNFRQLTWNQLPNDAVVAEKKEEPENGGVASGTGFFINKQGAILTNAHVVASCKSIMVQNVGLAVVQVADVRTDLAVLRVSGAADHPFARFDESMLARLGEETIVFGYPLSDVLATSGNLTTGNISALAGIRNDVSRFQISAPIQSGNSGGALLNRSGNVLGVIVSKFNVLKELVETGEVPQNVNFAIKGSIAKSFLDVNNVAYSEATSVETLSIADVAAKAQSFTVFILCERE